MNLIRKAVSFLFEGYLVLNDVQAGGKGERDEMVDKLDGQF